MKIISLNTWGGRAGKEKFFSFLKEQSASTDIFCLQEMWNAPLASLEGVKAGGVDLTHATVLVEGVKEISELLPEYEAYFHPHFEERYGLAMFVKKSIPVDVVGEVFVHKHKGYMPEDDIGKHARNIQYVQFQYNGSPLTVVNFHGLWNGQGKTDTPDRIEQSEKIVAFLKQVKGSVVLTGDFNLRPDAESIRIIENTPLRNLIAEYGVTSTRTSLYGKSEQFADYTFVSSDIKIKDFRVLPDEVSDHAALSIEIE